MCRGVYKSLPVASTFIAVHAVAVPTLEISRPGVRCSGLNQCLRTRARPPSCRGLNPGPHSSKIRSSEQDWDFRGPQRHNQVPELRRRLGRLLSDGPCSSFSWNLPVPV